MSAFWAGPQVQQLVMRQLPDLRFFLNGRKVTVFNVRTQNLCILVCLPTCTNSTSINDLTLTEATALGAWSYGLGVLKGRN
jgi:hypothetical protein